MAYPERTTNCQRRIEFFAVTEDHFDGATFDETPHEDGLTSWLTAKSATIMS